MADDEKQEGRPTPAPAASSWPAGFNEWLDRWAGDWPRPGFWPDLRRGLVDARESLRVEEFTEGDQMVVRVEMPGIDPDDVSITVREHALSLSAERREESTTRGRDGYRSEFRYGSFSRVVPLPAGASEQDVKATYKDGILEVRITVDPDAAAKRIPIERG